VALCASAELPILPDPYATNVSFDPRRAVDTGVIGLLTAVVRWGASQDAVLDLLLPPGALDGVTQAAPVFVPPLPAGNAAKALADDGIALGQMQAQFDRTVTSVIARGPTLLDLSTNVSQFGVSFAVASQSDLAMSASGANLSIANLFLQAPGFDVHVTTLPAVQWEPVLTPDQTVSFSSPLSYLNSGVSTELAAHSVTLVPIAPRPAIDALLSAYNMGSSPVVARFTLPLGIAAVAELRHSKLRAIPSPTLSEVRPSFSGADLKGGDQIKTPQTLPG
jgi:hypothetical protein